MLSMSVPANYVFDEYSEEEGKTRTIRHLTSLICPLKPEGITLTKYGEEIRDKKRTRILNYFKNFNLDMLVDIYEDIRLVKQIQKITHFGRFIYQELTQEHIDVIYTTLLNKLKTAPDWVQPRIYNVGNRTLRRRFPTFQDFIEHTIKQFESKYRSNYFGGKQKYFLRQLYVLLPLLDITLSPQYQVAVEQNLN